MESGGKNGGIIACLPLKFAPIARGSPKLQKSLTLERKLSYSKVHWGLQVRTLRLLAVRIIKYK